MVSSNPQTWGDSIYKDLLSSFCNFQHTNSACVCLDLYLNILSFGANINGILKNSSFCLFISDINITDFGVLTLYPTSLPNSLICLRRFIVDYMGFSRQTIMPYIKRESFISSFPVCMHFCSCSCLIVLTKNASTILNRGGEMDFLCCSLP